MRKAIAGMPIWKMVKEAIDALGGVASSGEIHAFICNAYGDVKVISVQCAIRQCAVNVPSRIYYGNDKPRVCDTEVDFLFSTGRGQFVRYDPKQHGAWGIKKDESGKLTVCQIQSTVDATLK